jgi:hypothetical protein
MRMHRHAPGRGKTERPGDANRTCALNERRV